MINFKTTGGVEGLITVVKPVGKAIPLNVGEIIKAEVLDLLPSGGATLRIKGSAITARTDVPLQKNAEVLLKVLGSPASPNELRLQFMGQAGQASAGTGKTDALVRLVQTLASQTPDRITAQDVQNLLKSLPSDMEALPREVRAQLQQFLQASLKTTGQGIQSRLDSLFTDRLPDALKGDALVQKLQAQVATGIDRLMAPGIRDLFRDTGVSLEAKLRAIAEGMPAAEPEGQNAQPRSTVTSETTAAFDRDLKAGLLQLKQRISELTAEMQSSRSPSDPRSTAHDAAALKAAGATVDGMLKDIETFQLLSKTTESFCTFLPVNWQELKDSEVAFKRHEAPGREPFCSCRINLDLDSFGKLAVMVLMTNNEYHVSLKPEQEQLKRLLSAHADDLEDQFRQSGLALKGLKVLDKDDPSMDQLETLSVSRQIVSVKV